MADNSMVFPPGYRLTNAAGDVVSGGKLKFYNAGTLVARTVYSNAGLSSSLGSTVYCGSDGLPVASSGSSTEVTVFTGTSAYKIVATTSADVEIWTLDNLSGALDTSTFLTSSSTSTLSIPVISKTGNYTIVSGDRGKLVQGNTSGGNFTLTLDAAATLGDGWNVEVRNSGTSGQLILAASQAIAFEGQTFTARALEIGEAMAIRCDGAAFKIVGRTPPLMASRSPGVIVITDRITADPVSPTPGARYIVTASYGSYATHDIIEANGSSFNKYTPAADCGWIAYVQDENRYYTFQDSAWVLGLDPAASSTVAGLIKISTQALMETGTATDTATLIGHQHYHPGHPKAWVNANGSGTAAIGLDYAVASLTDNGTGDYSFTLDTALSGTTYALTGFARDSAGNLNVTLGATNGNTKSTTVIRITTRADDTTAEDSTELGMAWFGDY